MPTTSENVLAVLIASHQDTAAGLIADIKATLPALDEAMILSVIAGLANAGQISVMYADNVPVSISVQPAARAALLDKLSEDSYQKLRDLLKIAFGLSLGLFLAIAEFILR